MFARKTLMNSSSLVRMADGAEGSAPAGGESPEGTKQPKAKSVDSDMAARTVLPNVEDAAAYLNRIMTDLPDFGDYPIASTGLDAEGNFDPAVYTDKTEVMIATLRKAKAGVKCIVIGAVPTLDALLESDAGRAWVQAIIHKELNHVLVRPLREAEDVTTVQDQMPRTLDAFISSARDNTGTMLESYDELFKKVSDYMGTKVPVWAKAKLTKAELRKALENTAYAKEFYPALENRTGGSLFVFALNFFKQAATSKGFSAEIFDRWLSTRDQKTIETVETDDLDINAMVAGLG